jgi:hypothetical protein
MRKGNNKKLKRGRGGVNFGVLKKVDIYVKFASCLLCHTILDPVREETKER